MPVTPGAILLRLREKLGWGLRVAYYRDIVRPGILQTNPIADLVDGTCEIHVMTSQRDVLNAVWALKSFYWMSQRRYRLCIHDDGSLALEHRQMLKQQFPDSRVIDRIEADQRLFQELKHFPKCLEFRRSNLLAPKLFDFVSYLETDRMLLFDSDLLFFHEPVNLLQRIEDNAYGKNAFNADCGFAYTVNPDTIESQCGHTLHPRINSGLGLVQRSSIRFDWVEEFLGIPEILDGHFWRIEQTLFALCSSRFGVDLLPTEYTLDLQPGIRGRPFRHYVGAIRHLMYSEGIRELVKQDVFSYDRARQATPAM